MLCRKLDTAKKFNSESEMCNKKLIDFHKTLYQSKTYVQNNKNLFKFGK